MASDIERKFKGLMLTEEEEEIVECEEEESIVMRDQLALCLVGKLLSKNPYSVDALQNTMNFAWRTEGGVVVREIKNNLFMFQFFSPADKLKVLDNSPWLFGGSPLVLKDVEKGVQHSELSFDTTRFWVKAYDVSLDKRTKSMTISIAEKMGKFMEFDDSDPLGWNKFMRSRVDFKIDKPLRRWIRVATKGGSKWIELKYEKLMDFCYACGIFGHAYQSCNQYGDAVSECELPYGAWLRASLTWKRRTFDPKKEGERKICQAFCGALSEQRAKSKLTFEGNCELAAIRMSSSSDSGGDMGYIGETYTWWNNKARPDDFMERLDRGVASLSWV
ncbi:hypothetical protein RDABS01_013155 [Bienertia sinuspersici]